MALLVAAIVTVFMANNLPQSSAIYALKRSRYCGSRRW